MRSADNELPYYIIEDPSTYPASLQRVEAECNDGRRYVGSIAEGHSCLPLLVMTTHLRKPTFYAGDQSKKPISRISFRTRTSKASHNFP
jgi:hypothetical protein